MPRNGLLFFFFNDTATTEIYTLSLHDALPISQTPRAGWAVATDAGETVAIDTTVTPELRREDRKSTRLNSSHSQISYAVFCLKKKKKNTSARQQYTSSLDVEGTSSASPDYTRF